MKLDKVKIGVIMAKQGTDRRRLAAIYGCSPARISAILNCAEVRPATAVKLAEALGVELSEILADN